MSVQFDPLRNRYVVRRYEDGRQRTWRFGERADALAFERSMAVRGTGTADAGVAPGPANST